MLRFIDEARNLVRFKHPNIVRVISVFELNDTAYIVMEFEEGIDFRAHLRISGNATESALKSIVVPIADGLGQVHQTGFIHRDIKPANILIRTNGSPVLLDFGSARNSTPVNTEPMTALVSAGYAPLEQYSGGSEREQGPWSDIYALGAVLYFAVTGIEPLDSVKRASALLNGGQDPLIKARMLGKDKYSPAFLSAIDWALQFKISDRPQSLSVWMDALLRLPATEQATRQINAESLINSKIKAKPAKNRVVKRPVKFNENLDEFSLQGQPIPNEVQAARTRRSTKTGYSWLGIAGILLVGIGATGTSLYMLNGGLERIWKNENSIDDATASAEAGKANSISDKALIENAKLQSELANARNQAESLAAELSREQEKVKANENARILARQKREADEEAAKLASFEAESAAKLERGRVQRRLTTQALDTASRLLEQGRFDEAEAALDTASSLDSSNERLIQLRARWRAAVQMSRAPVSDLEFDGVVSRFYELRRAIESKDAGKIGRLTSDSVQNDLFAQLMSRFAKLEVSIGAIRLNNAEKSISAVLSIDRMVRGNGDFSIPSAAYRERRLYSRRIGQQWSIIQW